jgi:hypothetical protein
MNQKVEAKYLQKCKWVFQMPYVIGMLYVYGEKWKFNFKHQKMMMVYILNFGKFEIHLVDIDFAINFVLGE